MLRAQHLRGARVRQLPSIGMSRCRAMLVIRSVDLSDSAPHTVDQRPDWTSAKRSPATEAGSRAVRGGVRLGAPPDGPRDAGADPRRAGAPAGDVPGGGQLLRRAAGLRRDGAEGLPQAGATWCACASAGPGRSWTAATATWRTASRQNDALQKYRQQFDLAQLYTYLTAAAYDYETNLRGDDPAAGEKLMRGIVAERSAGRAALDHRRRGTWTRSSARAAWRTCWASCATTSAC